MNGLSLLKCICEETRFNILEILQKNGELSVSELVNRLGRDQPLISHHLKALKQCKIVGSKDKGKSTFYFIQNKEISKLIDDITKAGEKMATVCNDPMCAC